jgi:hypothetical protein
VGPFFYFHFAAGTRRVVVDGVEPMDSPADSIQFYMFDELYRKTIHRDAETLGMEICLPVWQHREFIDAHRYPHTAITTLLLVTTEETRLEDLLARKVATGDIGATANTIVVLGSERVGSRLARMLCVVKHRGSAMSDEIVEYRVTAAASRSAERTLTRWPRRRGGPEPAAPSFTLPCVDAHVHLHPERLAGAIERWFAAHGWVNAHSFEPAAVADTLRARNVRRFCFFSYAHRPGMSRELNRWLATTAAALPDAIALGTLHPDDPGPRRRRRRGHRRPEAAGLQVPPLRPEVPRRRPAPVRRLRAGGGGRSRLHAARRHMPYRDAFTGVERFRHLMERFPRLRVCVAHMGAFQSAEFLALLPRYPHLYVDTTMAMTAHATPYTGADPTAVTDADLVRHQDRVLFGSDFPLIPYDYDLERGGRGSAARRRRPPEDLPRQCAPLLRARLSSRSPASAGGRGAAVRGAACRRPGGRPGPRGRRRARCLLGRPVADLGPGAPTGALALAESVAAGTRRHRRGARCRARRRPGGRARTAARLQRFPRARSRRRLWPRATSPSTRSPFRWPRC